MKLFNPTAGLLVVSALFFNLLAFQMNKALAFHTQEEMDAWLIQNKEQERQYYLHTIQVIESGNFPPQEIVEFEDSIVYDKVFDVYFDKYTVYDEKNPLDITEAQKKLLPAMMKEYPKTKRNLRKEENNSFATSKAKYTCRYDDVGTDAIGYGDNEFLRGKPNVKCITRDMVEWIFHKQVHKRISHVKNSQFYKKWKNKVGDDYLAGIYSKIYQWHPENFTKSYVYKLMLEDPFKNADKIAKEWTRWKQDFAIKRRKDEIAMMYNDRVFKIHLTQTQKNQPKKRKILNDALKEIGVM